MGLALSPAAWGAHGKPGLWEITIKNNAGNMAGMPDMSRLPPQARAQMQARGIQMNSAGMTSRYCMTAADVANDKPVLTHNASCQAKNMKTVGNTFSADLVCTGKVVGTGHVQITYASPEHYYGRETVAMTVHGTQMHTDMSMDGRWLSADCGKVKPRH